MPPKHLNLLALDPGGITGFAHFIIPRLSMFGDEPPEVTDWNTGEIAGTEEEQSIKIARMVREIQSLDYKLGPAVVCEDWDYGSPLKDSEVYSPVRIGAQLRLLKHMDMMGDARLVFQSRSMAMRETDVRLKARGYWVNGPREHERDAVRHAIMALRRAKQKRVFRNKLWDKRWAAAA